MAKDMSKKQFLERCRKHGFKPEGFMGYFRLPSGASVSVWNVATSLHPLKIRLRDALAYLIKENEKEVARKQSMKQRQEEG